jgi:dolichol-phosphate mannosyltransferase
MDPKPELQVLLPIHNEAASVEATLHEIYSVIHTLARMEFILCEDGSRDGTKEKLEALSAQYPMRLSMSEKRKGYSQAVLDGMKLLDAPFLLCMDSDGQCDPADFIKFWEIRNACDLAIGWRRPRADPWLRRVLSRVFYIIFKLLFATPIHDPSCPYLLVRKSVVDELARETGLMRQGFWWEWTARSIRHRFVMTEIPVHHRPRLHGVSQVYGFRKMPGIFLRHVAALIKIRFAYEGRIPK